MLPVDEVIPDFLSALAKMGTAVLVAPPGAGKTTRVPLALLDQRWATDKRIIVVEPRRLAARAPAAFMARSLGETAGQTVGYRVRLDTKVSAATRIEMVTAGVFVRMILDDPELAGIAAVLFDEVHERSLDADLGLALAIDARAALREDLRIAVMSATVDGARYAALLDGAPVIESKGRMFPVETIYLGSDRDKRLEDRMAAAVRRGLGDQPGSVLAFLPGQAEILRTAERLRAEVADTVDIAPLYGALDVKAQDLAIRPAGAGRRKVVLATSIAETSLTIEDVRLVIDSGLTRRPRFDPGSGLSRLETIRVSRAAADQRRGRAGRVAQGWCYRLWDEPQTAALQPYDRPEIFEADLSSLALSLLAWGVADAGQLAWLDPPPKAAFDEALDLLGRLGARDATGGLTDHGRQLRDLPLPPRLAHMIIEAAAHGSEALAANIAALLSEPGLGGRETNLLHRLERFSAGRGKRASAARAAASRWAKSAGKTSSAAGEAQLSPGLCLALAYPGRIARQRGAPGRFLMAGGRGARLDEADPLAGEPFLVIAEVQGGGADSRILLAAPVERGELEMQFADQMQTEEKTELDHQTGALQRMRVTSLGALEMARIQVPVVPDDETARILADTVLAAGVDSLPWPDDCLALRARITFARSVQGDAWPDLSDKGLSDRADDWLLLLCAGRSGLAGIKAGDLKQALAALLPWDRMAELNRLLPAQFTAPTGQAVPIDYSGEDPLVSLKAQNLFGLKTHPSVMDGRAPLLLELLSPAGRPLQLTRDLPGFWRGAWADVRADMRGRYPKHDWPEDPANAEPQTGAKRRR
jgi:ATP-dependent helicase HrpB